MEEIEAKFLEINVKVIVKKLDSMGADIVYEGDIEAFYYDFPDSRISEGKGLLRLRKKNGFSELTFKKKISNEKLKIMDEYEVEVEDFDEMQRIIESLGMICTNTSKKHRISYSLGDVHFELDTFSGIPTFLEIEANKPEMIEEYALKLGLSMKDAKPWTGKKVVEHYAKRNT